MAVLDFLNEHHVAGLLLVLAFLSFAIGAGLATVSPKGNINIFTLPLRDYLSAVAANAAIWRWSNIFMAAAAIILVVGLTMLTTILEGAGEHVLSLLGLVGMLLAAILWVIFAAFRATVTVSAAQEMTATGTVPNYYEPLAQWGSGLFHIYSAVGFLALAAFGGSLLQVTLLPPWAAWATIIFSAAMLVLLLIFGDILPILHYLPPLLVGILLLIGE
jgi:hypothetical protein